MSEIIPEIVQSLQGAADQVGAQVPELMRQAEGLDFTQRILAQVLEGSSEDGQGLYRLFGAATEKTLEAAAVVDELRGKIGAYVGHLIGDAEAASASVTAPKAEITEKTPDAPMDPSRVSPSAQSTATSSAEKAIDPRAAERRQRLRRKMFFIAKSTYGAMPATGEGKEIILDFLAMAEQANEQGVQAAVAEQISTDLDRFALEEKAKTIVDMLVGNESLDLVDSVLSFSRYMITAGEVAKAAAENDSSLDNDTILERMDPLTTAVAQEMIQRIPITELGDTHTVPLSTIKKAVLQNMSDDVAELHLQNLQAAITNRIALTEVIIDGFSSLPGLPQSDYNRPMNPGDRDKLNEAAAAAIEGIHIMKGHGITPMVVPGNSVGLPWDIAIVEPITRVDGEGGEGALADFILLPPNQEHRHDLIEMKPSADNPKHTRVIAGGGESYGRLRLHDNGQISQGYVIHNVPSDVTERQFADLLGGDGYERLRALLIAVAYDAVVPVDVVNNETGGSVARQYNRQPPNTERLVEIVLQRKRVLDRAQVSPQNRRPTGWEWPKQVIGGYVKRLPEGCKARPTAAEEAQAYFDSKKIPFDGLPEGKTFVGEHKRGTVENTVFRPAVFRPDSKTRQFLRGE